MQRKQLLSFGEQAQAFADDWAEGFGPTESSERDGDAIRPFVPPPVPATSPTLASVSTTAAVHAEAAEGK